MVGRSPPLGAALIGCGAWGHEHPWDRIRDGEENSPSFLAASWEKKQVVALALLATLRSLRPDIEKQGPSPLS